MGITAGFVHRTRQTGSDFKQGTTSQEQRAITTTERNEITYMRDCQARKQAKLIKTSNAKEFGKFAADEEQYEPMDDKSTKKIEF